MMSNAKPPTPRTPVVPVPVVVPEELTAVEYLMLEAVRNVQDGKPAVAVTNLCQCVWKAHSTSDPIDDFRLRQLMRQVVEAGGDFD